MSHRAGSLKRFAIVLLLVVSASALSLAPTAAEPARPSSGASTWADELDAAVSSGLPERLALEMDKLFANAEIRDVIEGNHDIATVFAALRAGDRSDAVDVVWGAVGRDPIALSAPAMQLLREVVASEPFQSAGRLLRQLTSDSQFRDAIARDELTPVQRETLMGATGFWSDCSAWMKRTIVRAALAVAVIVATVILIQAAPAAAPAIIQEFTIPALSAIVLAQLLDPPPTTTPNLPPDEDPCGDGGRLTIAFTGSATTPATFAPGFGAGVNGSWTFTGAGSGVSTTDGVGFASVAVSGQYHTGIVNVFGHGAFCGASGGSDGTGNVVFGATAVNLRDVGWAQSAGSVIVLTGDTFDPSTSTVIGSLAGVVVAQGGAPCVSTGATNFTIVGSGALTY